MFRTLIVGALLFWSPMLFAETIDAFVERAVSLDPELSRFESASQAEKIRASGTFAYPPLVIAYGFFPLPIETRLGPQRQKVRVAQTLPWFGIIDATRAIPQARASLATPKARDRRLHIAREIRREAWALWRLGAEIKTMEAHVVLLDGLSRSAEALVEVGRGKKSDVSQIAFQLAKTKNTIRAKQADAATARARLKRWTLDDEVNIEFQEPNRSDIGVTLSPDHPRLQTLDAQDHVSRAEIALQRKRNRPDITVAAEYFEIGRGDSQATAAGRDAVALSVGISLPIWSRPQAKERDALSAEIVAREFQREAIVRELNAAIDAHQIAINDMTRQINYLRDTTRPLGVTLQQDLTADYESQRASIAEVIGALDIIHHIDLERISLKAEREIAIAELEFIAGQRVTEVQP